MEKEEEGELVSFHLFLDEAENMCEGGLVETEIGRYTRAEGLEGRGLKGEEEEGRKEGGVASSSWRRKEEVVELEAPSLVDFGSEDEVHIRALDLPPSLRRDELPPRTSVNELELFVPSFLSFDEADRVKRVCTHSL